MEQQIKSKRRVAAHGEVFTGQREVRAMCDLIRDETERIESRFLEPACGNGNFLAEILSRKLAVARRRYGRSRADFERYSVVAVTSLYGVELLPDNAAECRERLFRLWDEAYRAAAGEQAGETCREAVRYILDKNILCGNALTMTRADGSPILFAEWSLVTGNMVKRRDFRLDELMARDTGADGDQLSMEMDGWVYDEGVRAYLPLPIKVYPLTDYREVQRHG